MLAHACYLTDPRIRREAETLAEKGYDIHVIALSEKLNGVMQRGPSTVNGVQIHRLPVSRKRGTSLRYLYEYTMVLLLGALKVASLHFQRRLNVVHVHNMPDILVLAGLAPRLSGATLVLDVHDPMPELYRSWGHDLNSPMVRLLRIQERISCRLADRVISVNDTMRENLRNKGIPDEKIFIVHNFPDRSHFPLSEERATWPERKDRLVILYCGTVTEHYDLGLAVRAMANLKGLVPITLKIMGEGNKLQEVLELASSLGVRDSIELVGRVPLEQVGSEMRKADLGISCHQAGIFGDLYFSTKIVEYLTQGLPVLSPRTYTIHKYLPDDSIFYFEPGKLADLTDKIQYIWEHPSEVLARLNRARTRLERLSWQAEKGRFSEFYAALLQDPSRPAVASPSWTEQSEDYEKVGNAPNKSGESSTR